MGINGLLRFLEKEGIMSPVNLWSLKGSIAAFDISCFMYPVIVKYGAGVTNPVVRASVLHYINRFVSCGIRVVAVFDGKCPPAKSATSLLRRQKAKHVISRHDFTDEFIKLFQSQKIPYVLAPYEADCQIALLEREGLVNLVVTLDSDLILYGCKRILFKMKRNGCGFLYEQSAMPSLFGTEFTLDRFRWCCILAGCDYFPGGVKGIGIKGAMSIYQDTAHIRTAAQFIKFVQKQECSKVTSTFTEDFMVAEQTFLHQVVLDVQSTTVKHLQPPPNNSVMDFTGSLNAPGQTNVSPEIMQGAADPSRITNFKCIRCRKPFTSWFEMRAHIQQQHVTIKVIRSFTFNREAAVANTQRLMRFKNLHRPYKCSVCNVRFRRWDNLSRHAKSHVGPKPVQCSVCRMRFRDIWNLKDHLVKHKGNKKFHCNICGKAFGRVRNLRQHLIVHRGDRVHKCEQCPKAFKFKQHLEFHLRTHTGEKPYPCTHCDLKCTQLSQLYTHIREKHTNPGRWVCPPEEGKKGYAQFRGIQKHYQKCHPDEDRSKKALSSCFVPRSAEPLP